MNTMFLQRCPAAVTRTGTIARTGFGPSGVNWVVALLVLLAAAATVGAFTFLLNTVQSWAVAQAGVGPILQ